MRGTIKWQVNTVLNQIYGVGISKRETREKSRLRDQNGRKVSYLLHSLKYIKDVRCTSIDLANYAKTMFGIRDIEKIDNDVVWDWIESKVFSNKSYSSISTYISHLLKFEHALQEFAIKGKNTINPTLFDKEFLIKCRKVCKKECIRYSKINRAYSNMGSIFSKIHSRSFHKAVLQYSYGLRSIEAIHLTSKNFIEPRLLRYQCKGGLWLEKCINEITFSIIRNEVEKDIYNISYSTYLNDLKKAVLESGEEWKGTHGLRYNYAQNMMKSYQRQGYSREKSKYLTSLDLGHKRPDITETYLR